MKRCKCGKFMRKIGNEIYECLECNVRISEDGEMDRYDFPFPEVLEYKNRNYNNSKREL